MNKNLLNLITSRSYQTKFCDIIIYLLLLLSFTINAQDLYFGKKRHEFVHTKISDSTAIIEFCRRGGEFGQKQFTVLDTLQLRNGEYVNSNFKIKIESGTFKFYPGKILLSKSDTVQTSLDEIRIVGYENSKYLDFQFHYDWVPDEHWNSIPQMVPQHSYGMPEAVYKKIDSEYKFYEESQIFPYCNRFDRIIVTDNRIFFKKTYQNTMDSIFISEIWNQLCTSHMFEKNLRFFWIQFVAISVPFAVSAPLFYLLLEWPLMLAMDYELYKVELFILNRFVSKKTFVLTFYDDDVKKLNFFSLTDKGVDKLKVKIRNDYITSNFQCKYKIQQPLYDVIK